jgi:hypothetical protein
MIEDKAALGVVALILVVALIWFGLRRLDWIVAYFVGLFRPLKMPDSASKILVVAIGGVMFGLLIWGVASYGLVNALPGQPHVERNRENSRMIVTEDKDGCVDMRSLGRSNGVYMSIKPCKPNEQKADK